MTGFHDIARTLSSLLDREYTERITLLTEANATLGRVTNCVDATSNPAAPQRMVGRSHGLKGENDR